MNRNYQKIISPFPFLVSAVITFMWQADRETEANSTSSCTFNEKASWICFLHNCRRAMETSKYYCGKKKRLNGQIFSSTLFILFPIRHWDLRPSVLSTLALCRMFTAFLNKCLFVGPSLSLTPTSAAHLLDVTQWWVLLMKRMSRNLQVRMLQ